MNNEDRAAALLDKYGDDLFRFAFVLTCSDNAAGQILSDAAAYATLKKVFSGDDGKDKKLLFSYIYKSAAKRKTNHAYDDAAYGKKSDTFMTIVSMPVKERAKLHLILYEDMTESETQEVTGSK